MKNGGLSNNDKIIGEEQEAAFTSPSKGKKRVTSEVRKHFLFNTMAYFNYPNQQLIVQKVSKATETKFK
jgi:hypothetical protein